MRTAKKVTFSLIILSLLTINVVSQDAWQPPKPLENKVYESMIGSWEGENMMMGTATKEEITIEWILNKQFIKMHVKGFNKQTNEISYEGVGIYGIDKDGNALGWWFDNWGASSIATGTGTFKDNMLEMKDGNAMFKETRTFEVKGNELTMKSKGTYTMSGQEMPFDESSTYKKK